MKKNGYLRRFLALFLALVMIMADSSVTTFAATVGRVRKQKAVQKFEPGESVSYTEILGNAVYFGIVANTVNKQAHMDSNFATKVLNGASGNVTTGAYTENIAFTIHFQNSTIWNRCHQINCTIFGISTSCNIA